MDAHTRRLRLVEAARTFGATLSALEHEEALLKSRLAKAEAASTETSCIDELTTIAELCEAWPRHAADVLAGARDELDAAAESLVEAL